MTAESGGIEIWDGFISYSHAADDQLAPRLQAALQRFAKPWWQRRAVRIFRDESSLSANPHLWSSITDALDASAWFVLLLSPDAAQSDWVNQEIAYWVANRQPTRILPVVTDGEFRWIDGDIAGNAAPIALRGVLAEEPRWVDLRWARGTDQLDLKDPRFADAVADIAATIRGIPKDELASEEVRQHRRTIRSIWAAGAALAVFATAAVVFGIDSARNASEAERQATIARDQADLAAQAEAAAEESARIAVAERDEAERQRVLADERALDVLAQSLATRAINTVPTETDLGLLLAVRAHLTRDTNETAMSLLAAVTAASDLVGFPEGLVGLLEGYDLFGSAPATYSVIDSSGDGRVVAIGAQTVRSSATFGPAVVLWNGVTGERISEPIDVNAFTDAPVRDTPPRWLAVAGDGSRLAFSNLVVDAVVDVATGDRVFMSTRSEGSLAWSTVDLDGDGSTLVSAVTRRGEPTAVEVWDLDEAKLRWHVEVAGSDSEGVARFAGDGVVVWSGEEVLVLDTETGAVAAAHRSPRQITAIDVSSSGTVALALEDPGQVMYLDAATLDPIGAAPLDLRTVRAASFGSSGRMIAFASEDGRAEVQDVATGQVLARIGVGLGFPVGVAWTGPDRLVSGSAGGIAQWDLSGPAVAADLGVADAMALEPVAGGVVVLAADGTLTTPTGVVDVQADCGTEPALLSVDQTGSAAIVVCNGPLGAPVGVVVDLESRSATTRFPISDDVETVVMAPSGSEAWVAGALGFIEVIDTTTGEILRSDFTGPLPALAFSADGSRVAAGGLPVSGDDVVVFDPASRELFTGSVVTPRNVDFSRDLPTVVEIVWEPGSSDVIAALADGTVFLIDADAGGSRSLMQVDHPPVTALAVSPDSRFLAVGDRIGVTIWDLAGSVASQRLTDTGEVRDLAWDHQGLWLIDENSARRLSINTEQLVSTACALAGRDLTREEWAQFVGDLPYEPTCPRDLSTG